MPAITLSHITKRYGSFYAVEDLSMKIEDNAFITLLGPSGCGKTTTLRMIAGLETPTSGKITIGDRVVFDSEAGINVPPNKRRVGFLFQNYALWPNMTVYQNISFGLTNVKREMPVLDDEAKKLAAQIEALKHPRDIQDILEEAKTRVEALGGRVVLLNNPITEISSTQLRRMLVFGCAADHLTPEVLSYIREKGLYGCGEDYRKLPMDKLEAVVTSLLKPNRVAHVLGCRETAVELAKRWGADPEQAARAGLLHDITKALDGPLQLTLCSAYGIILDNFATHNPKTLHALTGSLVAERVFGESQAVVSAICSHTTGKAGMNALEKIIYVADYMEPNRDFPGVEQLRHLAFTDLDGALKRGLEMTLERLKGQGNEVSPESREALAFLNTKTTV